MKGIIDRFEDSIAVIELPNRVTKNISRNLLPPEAKEGDVIYEEDEIFKIDKEETRQRRAEIQKLIDHIWETEQ